MAFLNRLTGLFRSSRLDAELDDELRSHLEMRTEMNVAAGMTPEDARLDALRRFGNRGRMKEDTRRADILPWLESLAQDVRYALRMFRKSPGFTAVTLLTLVLGIGANTAIFTLTRAVLLRDLPVAHPEQLVRVTFSKPDQDFGLSGPMFDEIAKRNQVYQDVFAWSGNFFDVSRKGEVRHEYAAYASGNTFPTLGLRPALGRLLGPEDDRPGGGPNGWAAVLSYDTWRSQFHGDARVLGSTLPIEGTAVTIVGVLPRDFTGVLVGNRPAFVLPLEFESFLHGKPAMRHQEGALWLTVMGRLKPGMTLPQARADIERIGPSIQRDTDPQHILSVGFFGGSKWGVETARTGRFYQRTRYQQPLLFLQALAGLVLFICCANVAGLMLARSSTRRHEFAVRAALGAGRLRMIRQLCVEGSLVALVGAASALAISKLASGALVHALMRDTVTLDLAPDRGVFLFTCGVAVLATFISSLPAALRASRLQPARDLKLAGSGRSTRTRMETVLVTGELALSVVLLVAAGLLAGSLYRLLTTDPGFRTDGMLIVPEDFSKVGKTPEEQMALYRQVQQRVAALPNIREVSAESVPMLSGWVSSTYAASTLPDGSLRGDDNLFYNTVGPNYFTTSGTTVLAGRDVRDSDDKTASQVCWLNRSAAEFFFPGGNAVGQFLRQEKPDQAGAGKKDKPSLCQVAGVVQDTKYTSLRAASPRVLYRSLLQFSADQGHYMLMVRTDNVAAATSSVRGVLREIAPSAPALDATTVREQLRQSIGRELVTADLAVFFGLLALLLVAVGIYGLLSYEVVQKTREIGLRMALGATPRSVVRLVVGRAGVLTAVGLALGLAAAYPLARLLQGLVFGVKPHDPVTFVVVAAALVLVALGASYLPARRATRVDPMEALRCE